MEYPERLLPKPNYCAQMARMELSGINPFLQRRCTCSADMCCVNGDQMRVTREAFGKIGLTRMSVNLLGGLFEIGDERWLQKMGDEDVWKGDEVNIIDYEGRYEYLGSVVAIYFPFVDANILEWEFPRVFATKDQFDEYSNAIIAELGEPLTFSKREQYVLKCHAECHHAPTALNYWHVEVRSFIDKIPAEEIERCSSGPQKRAINQMIEALRVSATLKMPESIPSIPEQLYKSYRTH